MDIQDVTPCLKEVYLKGNKESVFLEGETGIGKSTAAKEAAEDIAKELGKEFCDFADLDLEHVAQVLKDPQRYFLFHDYRLTELEPSDLSGIPREEEIMVGANKQKAIFFHPLIWAVCFSQSPGVLMFDELTNIQRLDVVSASYKLVLDRRAGDTRFSEGTLVIAAGNNPDDSSVANPLPQPLVNRFTWITVRAPSVEQWTQWMDRNHPEWDRRVFGYLKQFEQDLLRCPDAPEGFSQFPTPRSWTKVAKRNANLSPRFQRELAVGDLGQEVGTKLSTYLGIKIPDIEELIAHPEKFHKIGETKDRESGSAIDGSYLAASLLGNWFLKHGPKNHKNAKDPGIAKVEQALPLLRVMAEKHGELLVLAIRASGEKVQNVLLTVHKKDPALGRRLEETAELRQRFPRE